MPIRDSPFGSSGKYLQGHQEENTLIQRELRGVTVEVWLLYDRAKSGPAITARDLVRFQRNLQERLRAIASLLKK